MSHRQIESRGDNHEVLRSVNWNDFVVLLYTGPRGVCGIRADMDFSEADARIVVRRNGWQKTAADKLGKHHSYTLNHELQPGDEVVLQWRSEVWATAGIADAECKLAELCVWTKEPTDD